MRSIRETGVRKFDLLTDEELWYRFDILAAARPISNNTEFEEIEQSLGMNFVDASEPRYRRCIALYFVDSAWP